MLRTKKPVAPLPGQMELQIDRGQQLAALRRVRVGNPLRRLCLWVIDSHLSRSRSTWTMTMRDLADELQADYKTTCKVVKELDDLGVIRRVRRDGTWIEFSLVWSVIFGLIEDDEETNEEPVRTVTRTLCAAASTTDHKDSSIAHSPPLPPTPLTPDPGLVVIVAGCGVGRAGEAVATALAQGMTPAQIQAVVDHFRAPENAGRWSPGVLYDRLTRLGANATHADQGWFGDSPAWKARRPARAAPANRLERLEAAFGEELNGMDVPARRELLQHIPPRDRSFVSAAIDSPYGLSGVPREYLLSALALSRQCAQPP